MRGGHQWVKMEIDKHSKADVAEDKNPGRPG